MTTAPGAICSLAIIIVSMMLAYGWINGWFSPDE